MLRIAQMWSAVQLEMDEFYRVLNSLSAAGWTPAVLEAERRFVELAGITDRPGMRVGANAIVGGADFFFRDDAIFFLVAYDVDKPRAADPEIFLRGPNIRRYLTTTHQNSAVVLGLVKPDVDDDKLASMLAEFTEAAENAIRSSLDGRKARHLKFDWTAMDSANRLATLSKRLTEEGASPQFTTPGMDAQTLAGAEVLADRTARALLQELSEANFARETDILSRRGRKEDETRAVLTSLKNAELIMTQFLLQCRRNSTSLTRFATREQLNEQAVAELRCGGCNRRYADELLTEGYLVSELGKRLISGSHWMTVWVTQRLIESGISADSIMWNLEESGEEVDILVSSLGRLWILELKDREFGPGDAHPFRYRRVRYRANISIIVTTDKVSGEAKRIFNELDRRADRYTDDGPPSGLPLYIEGLDAVAPEIRKTLDSASVEKAVQALEMPSSITGFDAVSVLQARTPFTYERQRRR